MIVFNIKYVSFQLEYSELCFKLIPEILLQSFIINYPFLND